MNRNGEKPLSLSGEEKAEAKPSHDLAEQDALTRFDKSKKRRRRKAGGQA